MNVVLISTYELGRQPFGLASPAAWLKEAGASVTCLDLAVQPWSNDLLQTADLVAFYLPMHTATRIAVPIITRARAINPRAHLCCFGLYAPLNVEFLRELGVNSLIGGEFEEPLVGLYTSLVENGAHQPSASLPLVQISLNRQAFRVPDRTSLPPLTRYAHLELPDGERRTVGYTEASRGCKHLCRHCPIVPIYGGRFRVIPREIVLEDIHRQVQAGARHITFGDPDFLNGPGHTLPLVQELHRLFPHLTYDVTIKVEHLLDHADRLPILRDTGCLFITSAVESLDDQVLERLDKGHTRADFFRLVALLRSVGLTLQPTFVTFHPWTTPAGYLDLLETLESLDLVDQVAPIQYAIRLLIPEGSRLLELAEIQQQVKSFDPEALVYPWEHSDPQVDLLFTQVRDAVAAGQRAGEHQRQIYNRVRALAEVGSGGPVRPSTPSPDLKPARPVPVLSEPWFC